MVTRFAIVASASFLGIVALLFFFPGDTSAQATLVSPADTAEVPVDKVVLGWTGHDNASFDVYLGDTQTALALADPSLSYLVGTGIKSWNLTLVVLSENKVYYWCVVEKVNGSSSRSDIRWFRTSNPSGAVSLNLSADSYSTYAGHRVNMGVDVPSTFSSPVFAWSMGDGTYFTGNSLKRVSHTYNTSGDFLVSVRVEDSQQHSARCTATIRVIDIDKTSSDEGMPYPATLVFGCIAGATMLAVASRRMKGRV